MKRLTRDNPLRTLAQAERDGRLVVLPDKGDDKRPFCFYGGDELCPGMSFNNDDEPIEACKRCKYCSSGYERMEAEEALREEAGT